VSTQDGYKFRVFRTIEELESGTAASNDFRPPSLLEIKQPVVGAPGKASGGAMILALYATPTRPGFCRHIGCQILVSDTDGKLPAGLGAFALPMPKWLLHITASLFLNQDALFLHHQEKIMRERGYEARHGGGGGNYLDTAYTPTPSDKNVITFRGWLQHRAGGGVPWVGSPELPPRSARSDANKIVFDVYDSHVKDCRYCLAALKNVKRARVASFVLAAAIAIARPQILGPTGTALSVAGSAALGCALGKLKKMFYTYEFSHAEND